MFERGGYLGANIGKYDLEKLHEEGMKIKELKEFFKQRFPDSFGFTVHTYKTIEDLRYLKPNQDDPYKGIEDDNLRLGFDKFHSMDYRVFQGGENTYFYFLLNGSDNKSYIGQFGFKDEGDVPKEYVTSFVTLLHKLYGFPFKVEHEVYAKGGGVEKAVKKNDEYWERRENLERFLNYTDENIYWKWVNGELTDLMAVQLVEEIHGEKFNPKIKYAKGGGVGERYFVGTFNEQQLRNKEDKKAIENAQKKTGLKYIDSKIVKKGGKMFMEVYLIPAYAKGGGIFDFGSGKGNRTHHNTGRSWTLDHNRHNKSEDYEVPMKSRKRRRK